jgi:hypothetical protein
MVDISIRGWGGLKSLLVKKPASEKKEKKLASEAQMRQL